MRSRKLFPIIRCRLVCKEIYRSCRGAIIGAAVDNNWIYDAPNWWRDERPSCVYWYDLVCVILCLSILSRKEKRVWLRTVILGSITMGAIALSFYNHCRTSPGSLFPYRCGFSGLLHFCYRFLSWCFLNPSRQLLISKSRRQWGIWERQLECYWRPASESKGEESGGGELDFRSLQTLSWMEKILKKMRSIVSTPQLPIYLRNPRR